MVTSMNVRTPAFPPSSLGGSSPRLSSLYPCSGPPSQCSGHWAWGGRGGMNESGSAVLGPLVETSRSSCPGLGPPRAPRKPSVSCMLPGDAYWGRSGPGSCGPDSRSWAGPTSAGGRCAGLGWRPWRLLSERPPAGGLRLCPRLSPQAWSPQVPGWAAAEVAQAARPQSRGARARTLQKHAQHLCLAHPLAAFSALTPGKLFHRSLGSGSALGIHPSLRC